MPFPNENDAVIEHEGIVHRVVAVVRRNFPWTARVADDLVSEGLLTLWKCVRKANSGEHDPGRSQWATYAAAAVGRNVMRKADRLAKKYQRVAHRGSDRMAEVCDGRLTIYFDDPAYQAESEVKPHWTPSLFDQTPATLD